MEALVFLGSDNQLPMVHAVGGTTSPSHVFGIAHACEALYINRLKLWLDTAEIVADHVLVTRPLGHVKSKLLHTQCSYHKYFCA